MYDDLSDHPFEQFRRAESFVPYSETKWLRWIDTAERIASHSLDGSQDEDGYSYDFALVAFERGVSAAAYVASIRS